MQSGGIRLKNVYKTSVLDRPLITIVTVVFNGENTIEETILSVINQTYLNIEYIIIDGASSDKTVEVIKKYDEKIDYWISEPDGGIYYAMNKGTDLATGEWINFMNSGDIFYNNLVVYNVFENKNRYGDIVCGNTLFKFGNETIFMYSDINNNMLKLVPKHQSCFIKSTIMKQYKYDTHFKISADYNFLYKACNENKLFEYIDIVVSIYEAYGGISSKRRVEGFLEMLQARNESLFKRNNLLNYFKAIIKQTIERIVPIKILVLLRKMRRNRYRKNYNSN
jgi:glycosyltransferase involved in cell wall biosynthesis